MAMMTKLEAINSMLRAIGEDPVSSLSSGDPDAENAEAMLDKVRRDVLTIGWHSNTDEDIKIVPDVTGAIDVATDVLSIDTSKDDTHVNVGVRRNPNTNKLALFNLDDQTWKFTSTLTVTIKRDFPFEDLTQCLRRYIAALAAVKFQQSVLGARQVDAYVKEEYELAWAALQDEEALNSDDNILMDSPHCRYITARNNRYWGS